MPLLWLTLIVQVERFHLIKRASEILLDASTRHSYDDMVRARLLRKKRDLEASEDIRSLKSRLHAREAEAYLASRPKADTTKKLREETANYRAERAAKKAEEERKKEALRASLPASFHITTVMLKWDTKMNKYTEGDISLIVKPYGSVEATLMMKSGGAATIVFSSESAARALIGALSPSSPIGSKLGFTNVYINQSTAPSATTTSSKTSAASSSSSSTPKSTNTSSKKHLTTIPPSTALHQEHNGSHSAPLSLPTSSASPLPLQVDSDAAHHVYGEYSSPLKTSEPKLHMNDDDFEEMVLSKMKGTKRGKIT